MNNRRKLFCEISPFTYKISVMMNKTIRYLQNLLLIGKLSTYNQLEPLPVLIYGHKSLIRRKLGDVDINLQNNKAVNLSIAAPEVSGILIRPGETFSFWKLVGNCTRQKGYKEGLVIFRGRTGSGVGGGMCQFSNLIHWMVLHTPLTVTEHHHHDGVDFFPDFGRQVPFGTGTAIMHNYLDYRFKNETNITFQLITYTNDEYLCGEIRANAELKVKFHVKAEDEYFSKESSGIYRNNKISRECIDKATGIVLKRELLANNHAKVMYDEKYIPSGSFVE